VAGTGLGLAITRHLLQLMGSDLAVRSVEGQGSCFSFTLPSSGVPAGRAAGAADPAGPSAHSAPSVPAVPATLNQSAGTDAPEAPGGDADGCVLYVDDDAVNRELMAAVMRLRPQVRLILAATGAEGEALARDHRPDLALLDMMLPDVSGSDLLRRIRLFASAQALPCVVVSAHALGPEIEAARAAGFADYITKPIDVNRVLATVDRHLSVSRQA
jgi:CheY-like chemotaxis protein